MTNSPLQLPPPPASPGASTQNYSHSQFGDMNANFMTIPQDGSETTGTADYVLGSWFGKTVTYINEIRYFNTFRADRVSSKDRTVRTPTRTGEFRIARDGNTCWREEKISTRVQFYAAYNEIQRYELWRINLTQENYYNFVTGLGGVAVDAAIDLPAAGAAVAGERAATAAAAEGVALSAGGARLAFASRALGVVGATYLMFQVFTGAWVAWSGGSRNAAGDMLNDGWEFIRAFEADPVDEEPEESWEMVGQPYPCSATEMSLPETVSLPTRVIRWVADRTRSTRARIATGVTTAIVVIGGFLGLNSGGDNAQPPPVTPSAAASVAATTAPTAAATTGQQSSRIPAEAEATAGPGQVLVFNLENVDFVAAGLTTIPAHPPNCSYAHVHGGEITSLLPGGNGSYITRTEHLEECGYGPPNFFLIDDPR